MAMPQKNPNPELDTRAESGTSVDSTATEKGARKLSLLLIALPTALGGCFSLAAALAICVPNTLDPLYDDLQPDPTTYEIVQGGCGLNRDQSFPNGTCHHRGGNWFHDYCADSYGNMYYPLVGPHSGGTVADWGYGCDALIAGISFDGVLFQQQREQAPYELIEVKTADSRGNTTTARSRFKASSGRRSRSTWRTR